MKIVSDELLTQIGSSSWIRRMFDAGTELKKKFGADNVFDFSLGNPDLPPPKKAKEALTVIADGLSEKRALGYVGNAGDMVYREAVARKLTKEQNVAVEAKHIIASCGAAGAITSFFRAVLNRGDEVLCPAPYFVEYASYCGHFGGKLTAIPSILPSFMPDLNAIRAAISENTRVIIINSPNNPTGAVYSEDVILALAEIVNRANEGRERPIFILSDEPYRFLAYDGITVPSVLDKSPFAIVLGSFSKSLSMAGERIGYLAVNPDMPDVDKFLAAVTITTRTLGFVNAPIIGQRLAASIIDEGVDLEIYARRRKLMCETLDYAGLKYTMPRGAFYFFPEVPGGDDVKFATHLLSQNILVVPGSGFGMKGFVRLSFSVEDDVIVRSRDAFKKAVESYEA